MKHFRAVLIVLLFLFAFAFTVTWEAYATDAPAENEPVDWFNFSGYCCYIPPGACSAGTGVLVAKLPGPGAPRYICSCSVAPEDNPRNCPLNCPLCP